ncbi:hypothetical protein CI610_02315 [invertebrate metagenome]|uniref:Uncharacterized protein n=1 Tax=invertebrate metagenome TaxID=1711999 RepID=A0A2H9T6A8_9ZZZZ
MVVRRYVCIAVCLWASATFSGVLCIEDLSDYQVDFMPKTYAYIWLKNTGKGYGSYVWNADDLSSDKGDCFVCMPLSAQDISEVMLQFPPKAFHEVAIVHEGEDEGIQFRGKIISYAYIQCQLVGTNARYGKDEYMMAYRLRVRSVNYSETVSSQAE